MCISPPRTRHATHITDKCKPVVAQLANFTKFKEELLQEAEKKAARLKSPLPELVLGFKLFLSG